MNPVQASANATALSGREIQLICPHMHGVKTAFKVRRNSAIRPNALDLSFLPIIFIIFSPT
jgi:hypothetical protein